MSEFIGCGLEVFRIALLRSSAHICENSPPVHHNSDRVAIAHSASRSASRRECISHLDLLRMRTSFSQTESGGAKQQTTVRIR